MARPGCHPDCRPSAPHSSQHSLGAPATDGPVFTHHLPRAVTLDLLYCVPSGTLPAGTGTLSLDTQHPLSLVCHSLSRHHAGHLPVICSALLRLGVHSKSLTTPPSGRTYCPAARGLPAAPALRRRRAEAQATPTDPRRQWREVQPYGALRPVPPHRSPHQGLSSGQYNCGHFEGPRSKYLTTSPRRLMPTPTEPELSRRGAGQQEHSGRTTVSYQLDK